MYVGSAFGGTLLHSFKHRPSLNIRTCVQNHKCGSSMEGRGRSSFEMKGENEAKQKAQFVNSLSPLFPFGRREAVGEREKTREGDVAITGGRRKARPQIVLRPGRFCAQATTPSSALVHPHTTATHPPGHPQSAADPCARAHTPRPCQHTQTHCDFVQK